MEGPCSLASKVSRSPRKQARTPDPIHPMETDTHREHPEERARSTHQKLSETAEGRLLKYTVLEGSPKSRV